MQFSRRDLLRLGAAGLSSTAAAGVVSADNNWSYSLMSFAPVPGTNEVHLDDGWAYVSNFAGMATYDLSDPALPQPGFYDDADGASPDNRDVKVDGDLAGIADNQGTPKGGVTFFDVSDPASPSQVSYYDAEGGVHNFYLDGDTAYLTQGGGVMSVVDVSDPSSPERLTRWAIADEYRNDLGTGPHHDVYVQDGYAYMGYWTTGVLVADVTDPANPRVVSHFAVGPEHPENAHYVQPTPDREYVAVGAELLPGQGGIAIYHTPGLAENEPQEIESIEPVAGEFDQKGGAAEPGSLAARADPFNPKPIDTVVAPQAPQDALITSHNFDLLNNKAFTSWYQSGVRAYDFSNIREGNPSEGKLEKIAEHNPPAGDAYWGARNLASAAPDDDERYVTVAGNIGSGLTILELTHN
jgi:hypothetical protein